jgi:hypothetical protein
MIIEPGLPGEHSFSSGTAKRYGGLSLKVFHSGQLSRMPAGGDFNKGETLYRAGRWFDHHPANRSGFIDFAYQAGNFSMERREKWRGRSS